MAEGALTFSPVDIFLPAKFLALFPGGNFFRKIA